MMKRRRKSILAVTLALVFSMACLIGCGSGKTSSNANTQLSEGGVLCLRVNPEIAVMYDDDGMVTKIVGRNDDGTKIVEAYEGFKGKECRQVVKELVEAIGEAGYFVEEVEGGKRQITLEIEEGSKLPNTTFLDDIVSDIRGTVSENKWQNPVEVTGESDYGITDYVDTDYGPENDGVTDYDDTDYGPNNDGVTDYNDTDYGPNNDGVTDYDDGNSNYDDGTTDYNDSDYGN